MARAYQEAHILDSLSASVKTVQAQTTELTRAKGLQEEKLKNLTLANAALEKKHADLEVRVKAKYLPPPPPQPLLPPFPSHFPPSKPPT